jgi:hypothetical protein
MDEHSCRELIEIAEFFNVNSINASQTKEYLNPKPPKRDSSILEKLTRKVLLSLNIIR